MAYNKTTWATGDVITAEKLNNIEGGIEGNDTIVVTGTPEYDNYTYTGRMYISPSVLASIADGKRVMLKALKPENDDTTNISFPVCTTVIGGVNLLNEYENKVIRLFVHETDEAAPFSIIGGYIEVNWNDGNPYITFYSDWS